MFDILISGARQRRKRATMKIFKSAAFVTTLFCLQTSRLDAAVAVDGDLSDWGITLNDNLQLQFQGGVVNSPSNPGNQGTIDNFLGHGTRLFYHAEDSSDTASKGGFLGPHYGGQDYDGEFLGVMQEGSKLKVAIATGQRPDNGPGTYSPGDLMIVTSNGVFGIEIGGGMGNEGRKSGVAGLGSEGTSYELDSRGTTTSSTNYAGDHTAGTVWFAENTGDWILDAIAGKVPVQLNHENLSVDALVGLVDGLFYNYLEGLGQHAFIELGFDLSLLFGDQSDVTLYSIVWNPACNNDELSVLLTDVSYSKPDSSSGPVESYPNPEPTSLAIWAGIGLIVAAKCRSRRRKAS